MIHVKLLKGNKKITPFGGIVLLFDLLNKLGIGDMVDRELPLPRSNRGFLASLYVKSLLTMFHLGGVDINDINKLKLDETLTKLGNFKTIPHESTIGDWLRTDVEVHDDIAEGEKLRGLEKIMCHIAGEGMKKEENDCIEVTFDMDATMIACEKHDSKMTYKGFRGMSSMMGFIAEVGYCIGEEFRNGNVAPSARNVEFFKRCKKNMEAQGLKLKRFRADSASYQANIINECMRNNITFYIGAALDIAVQDGIAAIPQDSWMRYKDKSGTEYHNMEVASFTHCMNKTEQSFSIVVKREKKYHPNLFGDYEYRYHIIATNAEISNYSDLLSVIHFYNERGKCEQYIQEAKYGFSLKNLPCGTVEGNAVWCKIAMMAYNLAIYLKRIILGGKYAKKLIKSIRFLIYTIPGQIKFHSNRYWLKLHCSRELYEKFKQWLL